MSFDLLSTPIRKYIRDKRWESLRPIQSAAIERILSTNNNYILSSKTASGKTEAAFLPILSKVNFNDAGVQVLYISPLVALINDQFYRVEELCKYLDVEVTKWHGEANKSLKGKITKNPRGIILITPESIEAMFVNAPFNVKNLFSNLKYVVVDEIHSFVATDRGIQLKSLLSRLQNINQTKFNIVGLSATISDYDEVKCFTGDPLNTKVLIDKTTKSINAVFKYYKSDSAELPSTLLEDLYLETKDDKVLIFPNSRGKAEEVAVKLKKISERSNGHPNYFSHHSSVDKEVREYIEDFAKNNKRYNFCIACTSTLELGIDIGTVEEVVQIDATNSIASLIQRIGRSGRRDGESSKLLLYSTNKWSLLQSLACWKLYQEGFLEPIKTSEKPYDILLHQILSIVKEFTGCSKPDLINRLQQNFAFEKISVNEIEDILDELLKTDMLESIQNELIIGIEGEKVVNSKEFYSVFKTDTGFKVINASNTIGEIPYSPQIAIGENIFLAARIWKIKDVDFESKKILVIPAKDGRSPKFFGGGGIVHSRIRKKMLEILFEEAIYPELDKLSTDALVDFRKEFFGFKITDFQFERPIIIKDNKVVFYSFSGTKLNRSINFLLSNADTVTILDDHSSSFTLALNYSQLTSHVDGLLKIYADIDFHIENSVRTNPTSLDFSKWGKFLPIKYQCLILKDKFYDFDNAISFLKGLRLVQHS